MTTTSQTFLDQMQFVCLCKTSCKLVVEALQTQKQYHTCVCVKVYDQRKQLKRTMHLLEPIFSASFLNDKGDIVAALNKKLVVIRADSYQYLTADEMASLLIDYAKSQQQQQQPGQPLTQAAVNAQRAAAQLANSGSKVHQALVRQATMAQVIFDLATRQVMLAWTVCLLHCSVYPHRISVAHREGSHTCQNLTVW